MFANVFQCFYYDLNNSRKLIFKFNVRKSLLERIFCVTSTQWTPNSYQRVNLLKEWNQWNRWNSDSEFQYFYNLFRLNINFDFKNFWIIYDSPQIFCRSLRTWYSIQTFLWNIFSLKSVFNITKEFRFCTKLSPNFSWLWMLTNLTTKNRIYYMLCFDVQTVPGYPDNNGHTFPD